MKQKIYQIDEFSDNESVTNCNQLKIQSADGKFHNTDVADTEQLFHLIQSVPSRKAEPWEKNTEITTQHQKKRSGFP